MRFILGTGGHARVVMSAEPTATLYDAAHGLTLPADSEVVIGFVGDFRDGARADLSRRIDALGYRRFSAVHPMAYVAVDPYALGLYAGPMSVVEPRARMGVDCCALSGAVVSHDCVLGRDVFVGPNAVLCGAVVVGDHARIGAGAVVLPGLRIGERAIVGAGMTVRRDVRPAEVFTG